VPRPGGREIVIAATGDVHSPRYLSQFVEAVKRFQGRADLVLLAGDMVLRGDVGEFARVLELVEGLGSLIVAVFGNEEFDDSKGPLLERYRDRVTWLDDQAIELSVAGTRLWIVGSRGSLRRPTSWQRRNAPGIEEIYRRRVELIDELLARAGDRPSILLTHYSPTFKTLVGEDRRIWPMLGNPSLERVIRRRRPSLVIHGHAHHGARRALVDGIPVYNVSLPVWGEIVRIELTHGPRGLEQFL